jgi:hypothetical protein
VSSAGGARGTSWQPRSRPHRLDVERVDLEDGGVQLPGAHAEDELRHVVQQAAVVGGREERREGEVDVREHQHHALHKVLLERRPLPERRGAHGAQLPPPLLHVLAQRAERAVVLLDRARVFGGAPAEREARVGGARRPEGGGGGGRGLRHRQHAHERGEVEGERERRHRVGARDAAVRGEPRRAHHRAAQRRVRRVEQRVPRVRRVVDGDERLVVDPALGEDARRLEQRLGLRDVRVGLGRVAVDLVRDLAGGLGRLQRTAARGGGGEGDAGAVEEHERELAAEGSARPACAEAAS